MLLVMSMLVLVFVFWFSALIAEITLGTNEELRLTPAVRVGFGLLLSVIYFAAVWQVMPMEEAWLLGISLLLIYGFGKFGFYPISNSITLLRSFVQKYGLTCMLFMVGGVVFFAPLLISHNYGPFTEGGGDITIYADTAKLLTDLRMTSLGQVEPNLDQQVETIKLLVDYSESSRYVKFADIQSNLIGLIGENINPPAGNSQSYRVIQDTFFTSIFYLPYAQFFFLSDATNYNVYFGLQAFIYSCLLGGIWGFFIPFGKKFAIFAVLIGASSHGIISVFYNHYSMQAISITMTALILAAVPTVRLFSWAGFRIYGTVWAITAVLYGHFLAIVSPFLLLALLPKNKIRDDAIQPASSVSIVRVLRFICRCVVGAVFVLLCGLFLISGAGKQIVFLKGQLAAFLNGSSSLAYLGEQISFVSLEWTSFLFGFLSQQHYPPFADKLNAVRALVGLGVICGALALCIGAFIMCVLRKPNWHLALSLRSYVTIYFVAILIVIAHLYLSGSTLYTQAKGAQNVLIYFYLVLLLPLAVSGHSFESKWMAKLVRLLRILLVIFLAALLITHTIFALRLAGNLDRSSVLEPSFFSRVEAIHELDGNAFILFEPRKSSDVYLGGLPFAEKRMVTTRHLALQLVESHSPGRATLTATMAPDLIRPSDIPHLWMVRAEKKDRWPSLRVFDYEWQAEKLIDLKDPMVLLFGHDYERNFGERDVDRGAAKASTFSYLRNGVAVLYVPEGNYDRLEVIMEPRDAINYEEMALEIESRLKSGEFGADVVVNANGKQITLNMSVVSSGEPRLRTIARYGGEFWLSVLLDGKQL
jgi:hypothetical protein